MLVSYVIEPEALCWAANDADSKWNFKILADGINQNGVVLIDDELKQRYQECVSGEGPQISDNARLVLEEWLKQKNDGIIHSCVVRIEGQGIRDNCVDCIIVENAAASVPQANTNDLADLQVDKHVPLKEYADHPVEGRRRDFYAGKSIGDNRDQVNNVLKPMLRFGRSIEIYDRYIGGCDGDQNFNRFMKSLEWAFALIAERNMNHNAGEIFIFTTLPDDNRNARRDNIKDRMERLRLDINLPQNWLVKIYFVNARHGARFNERFLRTEHGLLELAEGFDFISRENSVSWRNDHDFHDRVDRYRECAPSEPDICV